MKKVITLFLLLIMATTVLAATPPPSAADRINHLAGEEAAWRYISGGAKLIIGGLVTAAGYSLVTYRDNVFGAIILIPFGITLMIPGLITFGWGAVDLFFGSRAYENEYDQLKLSTDPQREDQASLYLKDKAEKDKQGRQPSFWNAFGLFSLFETPAEREYNAYLKDKGQQ